MFSDGCKEFPQSKFSQKPATKTLNATQAVKLSHLYDTVKNIDLMSDLMIVLDVMGF